MNKLVLKVLSKYIIQELKKKKQFEDKIFIALGFSKRKSKYTISPLY